MVNVHNKQTRAFFFKRFWRFCLAQILTCLYIILANFRSCYAFWKSGNMFWVFKVLSPSLMLFFFCRELDFSALLHSDQTHWPVTLQRTRVTTPTWEHWLCHNLPRSVTQRTQTTNKDNKIETTRGQEQHKAFYTLHFLKRYLFPQPAGATWCVCTWQGLFSIRWLLMGSAVCSLTLICVSAHGVACNIFVSRRSKRWDWGDRGCGPSGFHPSIHPSWEAKKRNTVGGWKWISTPV